MDHLKTPKDLFVTSNHLRHHLLVWEKDQAENILCLHGLLCSSFYFTPLASLLNEKFQVFALDFRGHGYSDWVSPGGYYHFFDYVADLHGILQKLPQDKDWHVVAHSMGGMVMCYLLGAQMAKVKTLTLLEGLGPPAQNFSQAPAKLRKWLEQMRKPPQHKPIASLQEASTRLRRHNPQFSQEFADYLATHSTQRQADGSYLWCFDPLHRTTLPQAFYQEQAKVFIEQITVPVLLVRGEKSEYHKWVDVNTRESYFASAKHLEIPGATHLIHTDQPQKLAGEIVRFIEMGTGAGGN